jgi:hypothetical protein
VTAGAGEVVAAPAGVLASEVSAGIAMGKANRRLCQEGVKACARPAKNA